MHKFYYLMCGDYMFSFKNVFISIVCVVLCGILALTYIFISKNISTETFLETTTSIKIIIDAGHGGIDGGAVGHNGVIEKDINLKIALKLKDFLSLSGYDVILTRDTDTMLEGEGKTKKVADMNARLKIITDNPDAIFLSIHQNLFSQNSSWGAQVFYSENHFESEILASLIQSRFVELLQPQNTRVSKQTDSSLYLFKNAQIPAVLIECGFLSNAIDANNLSDDEYQNKVAFVIFSAICDYYSYKING